MVRPVCEASRSAIAGAASSIAAVCSRRVKPFLASVATTAAVARAGLEARWW
jgi:hypothetical protein